MGAGFPPQLILAIALGVAVYVIGEEAVKGVKALGHEAKVGASKIVHIFHHPSDK